MLGRARSIAAGSVLVGRNVGVYWRFGSGGNKRIPKQLVKEWEHAEAGARAVFLPQRAVLLSAALLVSPGAVGK